VYKPATPYRTQNWTLTKPSASGRNGIVVSQSREAAEAGAAILEQGGNAADAAVATCFALAAVEPWNSGLGGIGFAVVLKAGESRAQVVDFGPVAPRRADPADYPLTGEMKKDLFTWPEVAGDRNIHGPLSFVTPSSVAGYARLKEAFGSKLPLADLLAPAIALAKRGLPADWYTTLKIASSASVLRLYAESARIYLPGGLPPVPPYQGSPGFMVLGELPATLERLAQAGLDDFYRGDIARRIAADIAAAGGVVDAEDLANCRAELREAPTIAWRDSHLIHTAGGLTAAPTLARVVAGMADAPVDAAGPSAAWFAELSRVMRQAYRERLAGLGAAAAAKEPGDTCTTHLTVVDREGNLVAVTTTLLSSMGSRVVLPTTGVLMNNGVTTTGRSATCCRSWSRRRMAAGRASPPAPPAGGASSPASTRPWPGSSISPWTRNGPRTSRASTSPAPIRPVPTSACRPRPSPRWKPPGRPCSRSMRCCRSTMPAPTSSASTATAPRDPATPPRPGRPRSRRSADPGRTDPCRKGGLRGRPFPFRRRVQARFSPQG